MVATAELMAEGMRRYQAGDLSAAERAFRAVLAEVPQQADSLHFLGVIAHQRGDHWRAIECLEQAIAARPLEASFHSNLGMVCHALQDFEAAVAAYREALTLDPHRAETHNNLGNSLAAADRFAEAVASFERAIAISPQYAKAHVNLGRMLQRMGDHPRAVESLRRACEIQPTAPALAMLAASLEHTGPLAEAIETYEKYLQYDPECIDALYNKGVLELEDFRLCAAERTFAAVTARRDDFVRAHSNRGITLLAQGRVGEALDAFRNAQRVDPGYVAARSNWMMAAHYDPQIDSEELFAEHLRWATGQTTAVAPLMWRTRDSHRPLRIGYVSPDFRTHAVAYFMEPVLREHRAGDVHVTCYADVAKPDATTARLRSLADDWRDMAGRTDDEFAEQVRRDGIDLLVDLAGHTANNRLAAFARRIAPVQVSYLGYGSTTGLAAMDYRVVDAVTDPAGEPIRHTETLVRHPRGFACFGPPSEAPPVAPPPCTRTGRITFGCFNNIAKVSPPVVQLWADLVNAVPGSRLLLKTRSFNDPQVAEDWRRRFAAAGLAAERVELRGRSRTVSEHLGHYGDVDIALDPFPYTGSTTTCEALWMGVPVVSLRGNNYVGRMTASVLTSIGAEAWIAETPRQYQQIAAALAGDLERLVENREQLRRQMGASPVCDATEYTRILEELYRAMWRQRCERAA